MATGCLNIRHRKRCCAPGKREQRPPSSWQARLTSLGLVAVDASASVGRRNDCASPALRRRNRSTEPGHSTKGRQLAANLAKGSLLNTGFTRRFCSVSPPWNVAQPRECEPVMQILPTQSSFSKSAHIKSRGVSAPPLRSALCSARFTSETSHPWQSPSQDPDSVPAHVPGLRGAALVDRLNPCRAEILERATGRRAAPKN
jgi:hypothetical protein